MNLRQLQFVLRVAESGSFSAAAAACNVTQPALSNAVAQLEEEFGGRLFHRTTRRVSLTAFGQLMLPKIAAVLTAEAELKAGVRGFHDPQHLVLRIGLSPLVDSPRIARMLEPYLRRNNTVDSFFKECFLDDLNIRLGEEQLDVVIRPACTEPPAGTVRVPIYTEPVCVLGTGGPAGAPIHLDEVAPLQLVLGPDGCGLGELVRCLFAAAGEHVLEYPGQALSYQVMQDWALIGIGVALLPMSKISHAQRAAARPLLDHQGKPVEVAVEAWWSSVAAAPPHLAALQTYLTDVAPSVIAGTAA